MDAEVDSTFSRINIYNERYGTAGKGKPCVLGGAKMNRLVGSLVVKHEEHACLFEAILIHNREHYPVYNYKRV